LHNVINNLASARYQYNRALRNGFNKSGKALIELAILEDGTVFNAKIVAKDFSYPLFEENLINTINKWKFETISAPGDTTLFRCILVFSKTN
jgi:outer membrane biosynthesis protein TonB